MIRDAISEYFGIVNDGMIYAAILPNNRIWARKTILPDNLVDIAEIKAAANLPDYIQHLCDDANENWAFGTDKTW